MITVLRRSLALVTAMSAVILMSLPALAAPVTLFTASDFYIPRPAEFSDQVGVPRLLATFDVAANGFEEFIGQNCTFTVTAENGDSVHLNNYGILDTGDGPETETLILETESEPNVLTTILEDETLVIGPVIQLFNVMIPDPNNTVATSVDYVVMVDCEQQEETTTTTEPEEETTTTTEPEEETTTTTVPEVTTTTGFFDDTTTTTAPDVTSSSVSQETTSTTVPPVTGSTLPFTGPPVEAAGVAMAASAMLLLGGGVLLAARRD
jgi:hypothetical protein